MLAWFMWLNRNFINAIRKCVVKFTHGNRYLYCHVVNRKSHLFSKDHVGYEQHSCTELYKKVEFMVIKYI